MSANCYDQYYAKKKCSALSKCTCGCQHLSLSSRSNILRLTKANDVDLSIIPAIQGIYSTQNLSLWTQQFTNYTFSDGSPASLFAANYQRLYDEYSPIIVSPSTEYPVLYPEYYKWLISGQFPQGSSIFSTTDISYNLPTVSATTPATVEHVAGGSTNVVVGTFTSGTLYRTAGTSGFTNTVKVDLETPSGSWKDRTNKTANSVVLHQYNVTATTTFTGLNNVIFRRVFFNYSNTSNISMIFNNCYNIIFDNCVFNVPRNEGDGCLYFNVNGGSVEVKDCVFRDTANTVTRVELIGTSALNASDNIVIRNNWTTLNYPGATPGTSSFMRMFFTIPSSVTTPVRGKIYIVGNTFDTIGFANGHAYTDNSPKALFGCAFTSTRNDEYDLYIDNNDFINTTVANDYAVVGLGGTIPTSFLTNGLIYIRDTTIPNTYKKVMIYSLQTVTLSTPIIYDV